MLYYHCCRSAQIQANRKRLVPIIECILLCGREEIPLWGHRDFGKILIDSNLKYLHALKKIIKIICCPNILFN